MSTRHHIRTATAVALALTAFAVPAASAQPVDSAPASSQAAPPSGQPRVNVVRIAPSSGFSWTDAGIGGAAVFALGAIGLGGAVLVSSRNASRTGRRQPAATS